MKRNMLFSECSRSGYYKSKIAILLKNCKCCTCVGCLILKCCCFTSKIYKLIYDGVQGQQLQKVKCIFHQIWTQRICCLPTYYFVTYVTSRKLQVFQCVYFYDLTSDIAYITFVSSTQLYSFEKQFVWYKIAYWLYKHTMVCHTVT